MKKFGLSSTEKIKSKTDFKSIYSRGKVFTSGDKSLKAIYLLIEDKDSPGIKIAAAVHKKAGKAVWRNRFKRLVRDSYRLNKASLREKVIGKELSLKIVFSPVNLNERTTKKLNLKDIMPGVWDLMKKIYDSI